MIRALLAVVLLCSRLAAQFYSLTTTGDGTQLFFATSAHLPGTDELDQGRIYRIFKDGPELFAARAEEDPPPFPTPAVGYQTTNYFQPFWARGQ